MKSKTKEQKVVGFVFNTIDAEEGRQIVIAGEGNYADLKANILKEIPNLPEGKWFEFHLPDGERELDEKERRGICHALNMTLNRAELNWKATYSGVKKLFLIIPKQIKMKRLTPVKPGGDPEIARQIHSLRNKGMKRAAIAEELGLPLSRVDYYTYKIAEVKNGSTPIQNKNPEHEKDCATFVHNVKQFFRTDALSRNQRKAACVVGLNVLHLQNKTLARHLNMSKAGTKWNANSKSDVGAEETKALMSAFKNGR